LYQHLACCKALKGTNFLWFAGWVWGAATLFGFTAVQVTEQVLHQEQPFPQLDILGQLY